MRKLLLILLVAVFTLPIMAEIKEHKRSFNEAIISNVDETINLDEMSERELIHYMFKTSYVIRPISVTPQDTIRTRTRIQDPENSTDPEMIRERIRQRIYEGQGEMTRAEQRKLDRQINRAINKRLREMRIERMQSEEYKAIRENAKREGIQQHDRDRANYKNMIKSTQRNSIKGNRK